MKQIKMTEHQQDIIINGAVIIGVILAFIVLFLPCLAWVIYERIMK